MANLIITKPLLALRGVLIFPGMIANLDVGREKSIAAIDAAEGTDKQIILVGQKQPEQENVAADDLYEWGVLANIKQRLQLPNGAVRLLVEGLERVHVLNAVEVHDNEQDFFVGEVEVVPADDAGDAEAEGLNDGHERKNDADRRRGAGGELGDEIGIGGIIKHGNELGRQRRDGQRHDQLRDRRAQHPVALLLAGNDMRGHKAPPVAVFLQYNTDLDEFQDV